MNNFNYYVTNILNYFIDLFKKNNEDENNIVVDIDISNEIDTNIKLDINISDDEKDNEIK